MADFLWDNTYVIRKGPVSMQSDGTCTVTLQLLDKDDLTRVLHQKEIIYDGDQQQLETRLQNALNNQKSKDSERLAASNEIEAALSNIATPI